MSWFTGNPRNYPRNLVMRTTDNTLWTATGDCPFPFFGYNFCRVHRETERFRIDKDDRWCFEDDAPPFIVLWNWGTPPPPAFLQSLSKPKVEA